MCLAVHICITAGHTHTHTHTHTHARTHMHACMHTCTHTHSHTHKNTCTHIHSHVHTHTHTHTHTFTLLQCRHWPYRCVHPNGDRPVQDGGVGANLPPGDRTVHAGPTRDDGADSGETDFLAFSRKMLMWWKKL